jgi:predicted lactoylglutathione lyase
MFETHRCGCLQADDEFRLCFRSVREGQSRSGKELSTAMQTFINLPVKDLAKATEFFGALGFTFDEQFTDENATRMIVSEETSVMLEVEPFFAGFIAPQEVADTSRSREVLVGLSAESREQVDDLADKALAAGGQAVGEPDDQGFMYMRGFRDLDGHQWSFIYMDFSAIPEQ